ncbi:GARP complex subunit Vps54 [Schizosaccharomyces cryophilus OY26]|uniref:GARP complex subunit Vps54 n=1 Tax=Schizosaccharomyces cryophilus (strain OY26 / ATCC MYA-4695 / CBS 11777 / NBRC 106824 / NRRL Y48691) TaxID=653667 RepID=S9VUM9_SCHCR|nr:GARP complex subunit Vps54 [Schizosaccharomyces cryophilus OY26]EPY51498.1 GARP complex subunit Vps54 [Schizosaccharomyces cryophilus OY26]
MDEQSIAPSPSLTYPSTEASFQVPLSPFADPTASALSFKSLLEDPINPSFPSYTPTRTEITPVSLSPIPIVPVHDFQAYLHQISHEYTRYSKQKQTSFHRYVGRHAKRINYNSGSSVHESLAHRNSVSTTRGGLVSESSYPSSNSETITFDREELPPPTPSVVDNFPLSTIPSIYFQDDFNLDDPQTFDIASEHVDITQAGDAQHGSRKLLLNNSMLQEKISWYLDIVELHLLQEIENASDSFPIIMENLKNLKKDGKICLQNTHGFLENLNQITKAREEQREAISMQERSCSQLHQLIQSLSFLESLFDLSNQTHQSARDGHFLNAIDGIHSITAQLELKSKQERIDFHSLPPIVELLEDQRSLYNTISQTVIQKFPEILIQDIRDFSSQRSPLELLTIYLKKNKKLRVNTEPLPLVTDFSPDFMKKLERFIDCLLLTDGLQSGLTIYKTSVFKELESLITQTSAEVKSLNGKVSRQSISTTNLSTIKNPSFQSLPAASNESPSISEFYNMLAKIYFVSLEFLRRLGQQLKLLIDILSRKDEEQYHYSIVLNDLMTASSELILQKVTNINSAQFAALDNYSSQDCLKLFTLHSLFYNELENLCGITQNDFMSIVMHELQKWFRNHQIKNIQLLALDYEKEHWEAISVSQKVQRLASHIDQCATKVPDDWIFFQEPSADDMKRSEEEGESALSEHCLLQNQSIHMVNASVRLLETMNQYGQLVYHFPRLSHYLYYGMIDLLRTLNSRVYQLILGAGTVRSSGLSRVLGKHIALASQTVTLFQALSTSMVKFLSKYSGIRQTQELLSLENDFDLHHDQITEKFIALMKERSNFCCGQIIIVTWDNEEPHDYMKDLIKNLVKLYKVLHRYSEPDCIRVIPNVIKMFEDRLQLELTDLAQDPAKWNGIKKDLSYFYDSISSKCGYVGSPEVLEKFERAIGQNTSDNVTA